ncbi:MAG: hypothetical protein ABW220_02950 [Burkholderiaceae bacterium]
MVLPAPPLLWLGLHHGSFIAAAIAVALLGLVLTCAWLCVDTLRGLRLRVAAPPPCFAGDMAMVELRVDNPDRRDRWDISISREAGPGGAAIPVGPTGWIDVPPRSYNLALVPVPTHRRGVMDLPVLIVGTLHPLGLFAASARWQPALKVLIHPRPALGGVSASPLGAARTGASVWLDARHAGPGGLEQRLARLAAWVLQAERRECDYGLRLGPVRVPPGRGLIHRRRCLDLLGRWTPAMDPEGELAGQLDEQPPPGVTPARSAEIIALRRPGARSAPSLA